MATYESKAKLKEEIRKTSDFFIKEFKEVLEEEKDVLVEGVERTPAQILTYQLGWLNLLMRWDREEEQGIDVITPAQGYKWNNLGGLYDFFHETYEEYSLDELIKEFYTTLQEFLKWIDHFSEDELFGENQRAWASSTPSKWPVWKWIHINSVSPFTSFRGKIRK